MKSFKIGLFSVFLLASSLLLGQDYAFKVLASKGATEVKTSGAWEPIKVGASLKSGDEIKIADNAYLGLIHVTGKPVELKEAKTYDVAKLSADVKGGSSVINKYTDFILSSNSAEAKKNRLSATGAVHRGTESDISVMLPEGQAGVYNNTAVIQWESKTVSGPYVVTLRNLFDDVLASYETPEKITTVDLSGDKLASQAAILVTVASKSDPKQISKTYVIKKLAQPEMDRIKSGLADLDEEVNNPTALGNYVLAAFYEENNLIVDAITSYNNAIKLAPEVSMYQESYDEFLIRKNLKK